MVLETLAYALKKASNLPPICLCAFVRVMNEVHPALIQYLSAIRTMVCHATTSSCNFFSESQVET